MVIPGMVVSSQGRGDRDASIHLGELDDVGDLLAFGGLQRSLGLSGLLGRGLLRFAFGSRG